MKFTISITKLVLLVSLLLLGCSEKETNEKTAQQKSVIDYASFYDSDFFKRVQLSGIFADSKTFVDYVPLSSLDEILLAYEKQKSQANFSLKSFLEANFEPPYQPSTNFSTKEQTGMMEHINRLWPYLTRSPDSSGTSSLIPLPYEYVVPGGRFREIYYWDSYFTILGLKTSGREDLAFSMLDNFSFLIDSIGFIPNGNRAYYLGRSQPPFFALMVDALCGKDRSKFISYHSAMKKEYDFWMSGHESLSEKDPIMRRTVMLEEGVIMNRYYDEFDTPRPESFKEDYELVLEHDLDPKKAYRHLRAGAESGWDYSSRWLANKQDLHTIKTTDIIPIDLNVLLYLLELKIAQSYNWQDKLDSADVMLKKAEVRKNAINGFLWNQQQRRYADYNFRENKHTDVLSMATAFPLFAGIAPKDKARFVIQQMKDSLMYPGGLVTTTNNTGQQWDYPNAWAPLQWIGVQSFINYQRNDLAYDLVERWLNLNEKVFQQTGKMMEKYNVVDTSLQAGGGEYPLQDGFGWTNGIATAMQQILDERPVEQME